MDFLLIGLLTFLTVQMTHSGDILPRDLISDLIKVKHIREAIVLTCSFDVGLQTLKTFSDLNVPAAIWDVDSGNTERRLRSITDIWYQLLIVTDCDCMQNATYTMNFTSELFSASHHWLIICKQFYSTKKYKTLFTLSGIDSEITIVEQIDENKLEFSEVYNIIRGRMQKILLGNWTNQTTMAGLFPQNYKFSADRRGNLHQNPLRIVLARMANNFNPKNISAKTGYQPFDLNIQIFLLFKDVFNFSLDIIDSHSMTGDTAVMETIMKGEADIAPIVMSVILERAELVYFLQPVGGLSLSILFVRPTKASLQNVFFLPFSVDVWLSVFAVTLLTFLTLTFAVMSLKKRENCSDYSWNISEILLLTIGLACQQSSTRLPNSTAANMIINWFSFVAILLFSAYSGQIISFLSVHESPIQSVSDLSAFNYKLAVDMFPYISHFFKISKNKDIQELGIGHELVPSQSALLFVNKGRRCYCTSDFNMYKILNGLSGKEFCKFEVIKLGDGTVLLAMSVAHNSPYREMMNYGTLIIRERGVLSRYKGWRSTDTDICFRDIEPVDILDVFPVFVLLSSGILLSIGFLLIEILHHRFGYKTYYLTYM